MIRLLAMFAIILICNIFSIAYGQLTHEFVYAGKVVNDDVWHVGVAPDGTVFMAVPQGADAGLYAFDHSDTSFTNLRQVNVSGSETGITVRSDSIVFLSSGSSLYAFMYDDTSLTDIDVLSLSPAFVKYTAIGPGGIVFVTTQSGGIRAYTYSQSSGFNQLDQINDPITAEGIDVGPDSIIYVAGFGSGFYAFSFYDDSTFTELDRVNLSPAYDVAARDDGMVFFANHTNRGVLAYAFNGTSFDSLSQWSDPFGALALAIGANGTVFVANSLDGLRALTFNGTAFTNTAHINVGANTRDIAVGPDGVIYTADDNVSLSAWRYEPLTAIGDPEPQVSKSFQLSQNYPNPFNPSTTIQYELPKRLRVTLKIYDILGKEIKTLVNAVQSQGLQSVIWDGQNNEGSIVSSGIYFYTLRTDNFAETRKMVFLQ